MASNLNIEPVHGGFVLVCSTRLKSKGQGVRDRDFGTGIWGQGIGDRDLGTGIWGQGFGDRDLGTGIWGQGFGDREF